MIDYKNVIYEKLIHQNVSHLKLLLHYFQNLPHTKIERAKRKYFENISNKLSNKNLNPKKWFKKYLAYHQFTIMTKFYPILKRNVISLTL